MPLNVWVRYARRIVKGGIIAVLAFVLLVILGGLLYLQFFNRVNPKPTGPAADPSLAAMNLEIWEAQKPVLKQAFVENLYGPYPDPTDTLEVISRKTLYDENLSRIADIEQITYQAKSVTRLHVVLVLPKNISQPVPLIIGQNFAGNPSTFPFVGVDEPATPFVSMIDEPGGSDGMLMSVVKIIMGQHLVTPPLQDIIESGYGFAGFYPGEIVPDNAALAPEYLKKFKDDEGQTATGALNVWAWGFNRVAESLAQNPKIDSEKIAVWGHSRHGKAALLAPVFEDQVALVLSHQSGTGGASLGRSGVGESIQAIVDTYPHWFSPNYARYVHDPSLLPVDQHQLIALAAPTPILLGNGQHDKWSDPQTAFRALEGASPIYELYGVMGLDQPDLVSPAFENHLVFHMRPGPHGTRKSDWEAFLNFLEAHF